jgi:hypothetical protein
MALIAQIALMSMLLVLVAQPTAQAALLDLEGID